MRTEIYRPSVREGALGLPKLSTAAQGNDTAGPRSRCWCKRRHVCVGASCFYFECDKKYTGPARGRELRGYPSCLQPRRAMIRPVHTPDLFENDRMCVLSYFGGALYTSSHVCVEVAVVRFYCHVGEVSGLHAMLTHKLMSGLGLQTVVISAPGSLYRLRGILAA